MRIIAALVLAGCAAHVDPADVNTCREMTDLCTPDLEFHQLKACMDNDGLRLCGYIKNDCITYYIRRTCGSAWEYHSRDCE